MRVVAPAAVAAPWKIVVPRNNCTVLSATEFAAVKVSVPVEYLRSSEVPTAPLTLSRTPVKMTLPAPLTWKNVLRFVLPLALSNLTLPSVRVAPESAPTPKSLLTLSPPGRAKARMRSAVRMFAPEIDWTAPMVSMPLIWAQSPELVRTTGLATVMPPWSWSTADWLFTSITPDVTATVPVALVVAAWLMTKLVASVIDVMKVPIGMFAAAIIMPGARPVVLLPVIVVLEAVVTASAALTVAVVPSAEARPVFTTPPAMTRRPLHEELAALR